MRGLLFPKLKTSVEHERIYIHRFHLIQIRHGQAIHNLDFTTQFRQCLSRVFVSQLPSILIRHDDKIMRQQRSTDGHVIFCCERRVGDGCGVHDEARLHAENSVRALKRISTEE